MGAPVLVATVVAGVAAWRGLFGPRRFFLVAFAFLAPGTILSLFEVRGLYVASGFVPLVAGPVLDRAVALLGAPAAGTARRLGLLALALAFNSRLWFAAPALAPDAESVQTAAVAARAACTARSALASLDRLGAGTVLSAIDSGPDLLLQTHHAVIAAPYHRAIPGLLAGIAALTGSEDAVRRSAETLGADYLVLCPDQLRDDPGEAAPFATRLSRNEVSVPWLERVALPETPLRVWRVRSASVTGRSAASPVP